MAANMYRVGGRYPSVGLPGGRSRRGSPGTLPPRRAPGPGQGRCGPSGTGARGSVLNIWAPHRARPRLSAASLGLLSS